MGGTSYRFGDLELDESAFELRRSGIPVPMERRAFDVLAYLVHRADRVVSRKELLEQVWGGVTVVPGALTRCISLARRALGDDSSSPRFVETVRGRGYRFVAPVETGPAEKAAVPPLLGRAAVLARLCSWLDEATAGHGRLVLLEGEAGIGKTRTARELVRRARERGATVLEARCHRGTGVPALWPWSQLLRTAVRLRVAGELPTDQLDRLGPLLEERGNERDPSGAGGSNAERLRLFAAIASLLREAGRRRPVVVVIDDAHEADGASLSLLSFVARETEDAPIFLLATARGAADEQAAAPQGSAPTDPLQALRVEPVTRCIDLPGLEAEDVARLVELRGGRRPDEALTRQLVALTAGNPFFVEQLVDLLLAENRLNARLLAERPLRLPGGVRDVIERRLAGLSKRCKRVLEAAATAGAELELPVLRRAAAMDRTDLLAALDEARARRIIEPCSAEDPDSDASGEHRFVHALMRQAIYASLDLQQRMALHHRIGEALAEIHRTRPAARLAEIAHHFLDAAPAGAAGEAVQWGKRAADQAFERFAYDEAAALYDRVLRTMELDPPSDETAACETLLAAGLALSRGGKRARARSYFERAAKLARRVGRPDLLARAALGCGDQATFGLPRDAAMDSLLEEALADLGEERSDLRSNLLALRAGMEQAIDRRRELSRRSLDLARRSTEPHTLAAALVARFWGLHGPDHAGERLAIADELLAVARGAEDKDDEALAHELRFGALLALGNMSAADDEIDALERLATEMRQPVEMWVATWFRTNRALISGRFDEAESGMQRGLALAERTDYPAGSLVYGGQMLWLAYERGDLDVAERALEAFRGHYPWAESIRRIGLAFIAAEAGALARARGELDDLAPESLRRLPRDDHWLMSMGLLATASTAVGDRDRAETIYELLAPFAELTLTNDLLRLHIGSASRPLGMLAASLGNLEMAESHFESALATETRMGALPSAARTRLAWASALAGVDRAGARSRARDLAGDTLAAARALGMRLVEPRARDLLAALA